MVTKGAHPTLGLTVAPLCCQAMTKPIPVIELAGSATEIGWQHGENLSEEIAGALESWGASSDFVDRLLSATSYEAEMAVYVPGLLAELDAIADGAQVDRNRLFAYNLLDEGWWFARDGRKLPPGCSVVWRPGVLAQNMDLEDWTEGWQVVLAISPNDAPSLRVLTMPGFLGLTGANEAGVAVCVTNLAMLRHQSAGVPVAAVIRGILSHSTMAAGADFVRSVPHAAAQTYVIAEGVSAIALEASAAGVVEAPIEGDWWGHTNHPLVSDDLDDSIDANAIDESIHSSERLAILEGHRDELTALEEVSFPGVANGLITFGTVRYDLVDRRSDFFHPLAAVDN